MVRRCLCLVCSTCFAANTLPLPCVRPLPQSNCTVGGFNQTEIDLAGHMDMVCIASDEDAYPALINSFAPIGLKGLMVTSLLAAFMSTLDSQLSYGSSYVINDLYIPYIAPGKTDQVRERRSAALPRASAVVLSKTDAFPCGAAALRQRFSAGHVRADRRGRHRRDLPHLDPRGLQVPGSDQRRVGLEPRPTVVLAVGQTVILLASPRRPY